MNIRMRYLVAVAMSILMAAHSVCAAENKSGIVGAGVSSCGKFLVVAKDHAEIQNFFVAWTQGYLSALNVYHLSRGTTTDLSNAEGQKLWINNFCEAYPLEKYVVAVTALWAELRDHQGLEPDKHFDEKD